MVGERIGKFNNVDYLEENEFFARFKNLRENILKIGHQSFPLQGVTHGCQALIL